MADQSDSAVDVSNDYVAHRDSLATTSESQELLRWYQGLQNAVASPVAPQPPEVSTPLEPFPTNRQPPKEQSTAGRVMRNIGEIVPQGVAGVETAISNAMGWAINPFADWLNEHVADLRYTWGEPKTMTGSIAKSLSEFLTGFIPAMKGLRAIGMTGKVAAPVIGGALADFAVRDPHEQRLSNLWKQAGLPENVLTDYLAADPGDSSVEGRFKSAVESAFTGVAAEGVTMGARALQSLRKVTAVRTEEEALLKARFGELSDKQLVTTIGDESKPLVQTVSAAAPEGKLARAEAATAEAVPDDLIGGRGVVSIGEMKVYVNFARIKGPDDMKAVIADMAEKFKSQIDESRRGVITHNETKALAEDLGMTVDDLLSRRKGQTFNAEEVTAARMLWASSAESLLTATRKAAEANAGPLDQFAFRRAMAMHAAITNEVIGARTEGARALDAWNIKIGGNIERARAVSDAITAMGGEGSSQEMARRLLILTEQGGDKAALAKFVEKGWGAKSFDALREVWINGLLSAPSTHLVNTMSNMAVAFQSIVERGVAEKIGMLRGSEGGVAPGEAAAMAYGTLRAIRDAFTASWKALKTGETGIGTGKVDIPPTKAISSETIGMSSSGALGRTVDFLGTAFNVPSRLMTAEDEFFKTIGYRAELSAQALRQATAEGKTGDALWSRIREIELDPPENIRIASVDSALYNTFANAPGEIGKAFLDLRSRIPALTFILPFIRTPANIASYTFERTPLAPLVGQWRADIAAGGARADLALARMSTGTAILASALDWADSGLISGKGPKDAGEREAMQRQGWQQYAIKVGDKWYQYSRADPFGSLLGFAADAAERIRTGEISDDDVNDWNEVMSMGVAAIAQTVVNKTYLKGLSDFFNLMNDPQRYGERYIESLVSSFLPFTSLSAAVERAVDPTVRETRNPWEAVTARLAGLSDQLPARRDLWGQEVRAESGIGKTYDFFTPLATRTVKPEPIDTEIMRLAPIAEAENVPGSPPQRIGKKTSFMGVQVNFKDYPQAYEQYVKLAGNEAKDPAFDMGAKDFLNALVTGKSPLSQVYAMRSDEMKMTMINQVIERYRRLAQTKLMDDPKYAEFADHVRTLQAVTQAYRMPVVPAQ